MTSIHVPNVRKIFIPDPGFTMFEADLKGADAQVVAWEAEDDDLKAAFRRGVDIHAHNAEAMWGAAFTNLPGGSHARSTKRQECKHTVHSCNYGGSPRTTAIQRGWTVKEAERFHRRWFDLHPGIEKWHERVRRDLGSRRTVTNRFGFRRVFYDRPDASFTEALAWIPQSTVAINTFLGALQLEARYWPHQQAPGWSPTAGVAGDLAGLLLQTHDSINFQFPRPGVPLIRELQSVLSVPIPYDDPLTIPWDIKCSDQSWGEMKSAANGAG